MVLNTKTCQTLDTALAVFNINGFGLDLVPKSVKVCLILFIMPCNDISKHQIILKQYQKSLTRYGQIIDQCQHIRIEVSLGGSNFKHVSA